MKAIILAAGMGTRLGKYTKNLPKCMLNFKNKTLIQRTVDSLREAGISDITIVKGYQASAINIPGIKYYTNEDFESTNMVETLFKAEAEMSGEMIVLYSDVVFEKEVLRKMMNSTVDIGVAVDIDYLEYWKSRLNEFEKDIESLVIDDEDKIVELGDTSCGLDKAKVRYVGMLKFSAKGVRALKEVYHEEKELNFDKNERWLRSKSFRKAYMTCILQALINHGYRVDPVKISRGWVEFDTVEDYERANEWDKNGIIKKFINID